MIDREMYRIRSTPEQVFKYLDSMPPIETEDGRLITFGDWVGDYISRTVDAEIRTYLGQRDYRYD
jgi:hypothetical protein